MHECDYPFQRTYAAVPGATSSDVLAYQVPQAVNIFQPRVVTLSVGGNDLLRIPGGADPVQVLTQFQASLFQILCGLRQGLPQSRIYSLGIGPRYVSALSGFSPRTKALSGLRVPFSPTESRV